MNSDHFQTTASATGPNKTNYGTPWAGYLIGYRTGVDIFGPDATHWDSLAPTGTNGLRRIDFINPLGFSPGGTATQLYSYDASNRVIGIRDHATATPPNIITLVRTAGVVTRVTTSDGRGWNIGSTDPNGMITSVEPDGGKGSRFFSYNSARRVTQVRDANNDVMYDFTYTNDAQGNATVLNLEKRFVDGALETASNMRSSAHRCIAARNTRPAASIANQTFLLTSPTPSTIALRASKYTNNSNRGRET